MLLLIATLMIVTPVLAFIIWREVLSASTKSKVKGWHWLVVVAVILFSGWYAIKRYEADDAIKAFEAAKNYTVNGVKNPYGVEKLLFSWDLWRKDEAGGVYKIRSQEECTVHIYEIDDDSIIKIRSEGIDYLNKINQMILSEKRLDATKNNKITKIEILDESKKIHWGKWKSGKNILYKIFKEPKEVDAVFDKTEMCLKEMFLASNGVPSYWAYSEIKYPIMGVFRNDFKYSNIIDDRDTVALSDGMCFGAHFINIKLKIYVSVAFDHWAICPKRARIISDAY